MSSFSSKIIAPMLAALALSAFPAQAQQATNLTLPGAEAQQKPSRAPLPPGATVSGAGELVKEMSSQAGRSLDQLIGTAVTPRREAEIGALSERQRRIMDLQYQVQEAELARELLEILHGDEKNSQAEEIERLKEENDNLVVEISRLRAAAAMAPAAQATPDPDPVVASIMGAGGAVKAKILVPYSGEVVAARGTVLPNGMKVVSISRDGVTVTTSDGATKTLAFGDSVPRVRPPATPATTTTAPNGVIVSNYGR